MKNVGRKSDREKTMEKRREEKSIVDLLKIKNKIFLDIMLKI